MCKPSLFQKWRDILWLGGNLHNVGKLVSYLHIVVLALELSIFKEHFKMCAKKGCSWTSVISYPFGTHSRGLLNLWLPHNTACVTMINSLGRHHRKIIKGKFRWNRNFHRNHLSVWKQFMFWYKVILCNYVLPMSHILEELFQKTQVCIRQTKLF